MDGAAALDAADQEGGAGQPTHSEWDSPPP